MKNRFSLFAILLVGLSVPAWGQANTVLDDTLEVAESLRPFDNQVREQLKVWLEKRGAAMPDGQQTAQYWKVTAEENPLAKHGAAMLNYAKAHRESPDAMVCLMYVIDWGEGRPASIYSAACEEVIRHHADNPALTWLCSRCNNAIQYEAMSSFLSRLQASSSSPAVRAAAMVNRARLIDTTLRVQTNIDQTRERFAAAGAFAGRPELKAQFDYLARLDRDELIAKRDALLAKAMKLPGRPLSVTRTFGRLDYQLKIDSSTESFRELAEDLAYEIANLRVACVAPKFEARLTDGTHFRLSDRRGKLTLLVFSYKGCVPCERLYPTLRKIQASHSDKGFSVVGVMADEKSETVIAAQKSNTITWPCAWEARGGPIAKAYRVSSYPTVILLDGDGKIAARGLREEQHLIEKIESLLP